MEIFIIVITALLILLGFIGIFVPVLPGATLIFLGTLVYGIYDGFEKVTWPVYLWLLVLTAIILALDYLASVYGAKRFGASRLGILGAFLGGVLGFFVSSFLGLILGAIFGAVLFELFAGKNLQKAIKAGWGVLLGFLGGIVLKTILALAMIGIFLWKVL